MGSSVAVRGYAVAMFFLILGGLVVGWMAATGRNPVEGVLGKRAAWAVFVAVGLAAVFVGFLGRNTFLPFLGPTVFPCGLLEDKVPEGASTTVTIQTRPGAKILYWAAEPGMENMKTIPTWRQAYAKFSNAGVVTADAGGSAELRVRSPQSYSVPYKGVLVPHVHYRICLPDGGLSQVETIRVADSAEMFQDVAASPTMTDSVQQVSQEPTAVVATAVVATAVVDSQQPQAVTQELPRALPPNTETPTAAGPSSVPTMEGFASGETLYATADPAASQQMSLLHVGTDQRLFQVRDHVEKDSESLFDEFGFAEGPQIQGADFAAAYMEPMRPSMAPSSAF